jgi:tetratricopeptide (TPR) repeat protein
MYRVWIWTLIFAVAPSVMRAEQVQESLWSTARDAYLNGDYTTAAAGFDEYLRQVPGSASAMYNLANCYLQLGDIGRAILFYERARKLRPYDGDIRHNLEIARSRIANPIVEIREFFLTRWLWSVSGVMSTRSWAILSLLFFWVAVSLIALRMRSPGWQFHDMLPVTAGICFVFAMLMGAQRSYDLRRMDRAVIMHHETVLTIAPDHASKLVAKVSAGETVLIMDSLGTFLKVRLPNFEHGWVENTALEKI